MRLLLSISLFAAAMLCNAQVSRLGTDVTYAVEGHVETSDGDYAPFWFSNNKYGLSTLDPHSGYVRASVKRAIEADSTRQWAIGYGADLAVSHNHPADFVIQQLYGEAKYKGLKLIVGSKELPMPFANPELSSGDMVMSTNSRPIPQIRLEMPDFWNIPGTEGWVGVKAHIAYGWYTDNRWQRNFAGPNKRYTNNSHYHSKAIFFRIGNEQKLKLTFTGGIKVDCQFGGEGWNLTQRMDDNKIIDLSYVNMNNGVKSYWNALAFGGCDPNDGDFKNVEGNHVGSWYGNLNYNGKGWSVRGYFQHYFDDHSQLFMQYGWKDMLWGIEGHLPKNPFVSTVLAEFISTKDQTSAVYHDATPQFPIQISGKDNYYSHMVYGAWQHWGMIIGNPLLISPAYNNTRLIEIYHSRIKAIHLGISGNPSKSIHYRLLYTHMRSWGTYDYPLADTKHANFVLAEMTLKPKQLKGWSLTGAFGMNSGDLLKKTTGGSISIRKEGLIK